MCVILLLLIKIGLWTVTKVNGEFFLFNCNLLSPKQAKQILYLLLYYFLFSIRKGGPIFLQ